MNLAIVKHIGAGSSDKKYVFSLPAATSIGKGTLLALETRNGNQIGQLVDQVVADGSALEYILRGFGTDEKHLMPVRGIFVGKTFDELRAEHIVSDRYKEGGEDYIRVCADRDKWKTKYIAANNDLDYETDRRESLECDLHEAKAKLTEVETERDMLKSKLDRILKCCGVGE